MASEGYMTFCRDEHSVLDSCRMSYVVKGAGNMQPLPVPLICKPACPGEDHVLAK